MKKIISLLVLATAVSVSGQTTKQFALAFDYAETDLADTNIVFRAHSSSNIIVPIETWPVLPTLFKPESTNAGTVVFVSASKVTATAPKTFFAVSASNEWGIVFSDAIATGPAAKAGRVRLR